MTNYRTTLLISLAVIVFTAGSAMAGKRQAQRITAGSVASGDWKLEVWKTACGGTAIT